ncbi:MAG: ATP-binding cassette domain-containing protein [Erysipelotrichales bacterium]|nr:ATP-binding cassette domain-containing protein [Erysipelotrichales bacterium]
MLEIKDISKSYKDVQALKNINLTLENGVYALLGPNGAGKSTLMNALCCQIKVSGEILWNNHSIQSLKKEYYKILGYAPQQQGLYDDFSGLRFLTYMALLKGIKKKDIEKEVKRVAEIVNMTAYLPKKCKTYSGGMKQRLLVAQAFIGQPEIILLDEPTAGLDPKERISLREVFKQLGENHILLVATHVVSDVETIAQKIIFLKKGEIVDQGTVCELLKKYHKEKLEDVYVELYGENYDF